MIRYKKLVYMIFAVGMFLTGLAMPPSFAAQTGTGRDDSLTNRIQVQYNDKNGLSTSEANVVLQTSDGYIWIGGYGGLLRYDGKEFRNYSTENSGLKSSGIRALFEDAHGRLWVGTNDRGVYLYENGSFVQCRPREGAALNSIRCFAQDAAGTIYVGTGTGLAFIDENGMVAPVDVQELENQTVYSLSVDENGVLWGSEGAGSVFALKDMQMKYWFAPGTLSEYENYSVLADGDTIYIGTSGDILVRLTFTDDNYTDHSYKTELYSTGTLQTTNALCKTKGGELWFGTNGGVGWFDSSMTLHIPEGLTQNTFITCLAEDYEGGLWAASSQGGVFLLTAGKFLTISPTTGLAGKPVNATARIDGVLYAGTDNGLHIVDDDLNPIENDLTRQLEHIRIRHLFADSRGELWISTYSDSGLLRYVPTTGEVISISEKDGLLSNKVRMVLELENGDMGVATTGGINRLRDGRIIESYGKQQGIQNTMILCLIETRDGTLLAGSDGMGIYAIEPDGTVNCIDEEDGLTAGVVLRICEDEKADGFWISAGSGLFYMDRSGKIREISEMRFGIGSVFDILPMENDIWFMKSSGLIIISRDELLGGGEMTATQYGKESGLMSSLTANAWNYYDNGILYLCTVNGIVLLDTGNIPKSITPPRTTVNEIRVESDGGQVVVYQNPDKITLPADARRITLNVACLSYTTAPCTLRYWMEGFDEQPVVISSDKLGKVSYTNLKGGDYVFRLTATNADGVAAESETVVTFHKELALTERIEFWGVVVIGAAILIILMMFLVTGLKTRSLRRRQQEYKAITDQALQTIANTIDAKDAYTKGHSMRVADCSRELARRMGLSEDEQENVYYIALLHDIGKIGIPDAILNKPGRLTDEEFSVMKSHTEIGRDILKDFTALPNIGEGALSHHEHYDGSGYPLHKKNEEIPLVARIICAADAYDAMATKRSYKEVDERDYILAEFARCSGTQFDPRIAEAMIELIRGGFRPEG